jgi:3-oxoacyl-[acyl-carrier-protein] synthase II
MTRRRVVVTGLGCLTPAGNDVASTWSALLAGRSAVRSLEFLSEQQCGSTIGAPVTGFEPERLDVRQDVTRMGRSSQFALAAASEAWRDGGLAQATLDRTRCGCLIGTGIGDAVETFHQTKSFLARGVKAVHPLYVTKVMPNAASGLMSVEFGLAGPVFTISSACASGGHAIGTALRLIQAGDADLILAGGVEEVFSCVINPAAFDVIRALSRRNSDPARASRPFDRDRDGFVLAEGSGMVILEDLDHALARGARIYAEVSGVGMTNDAHHVTAPEPTGDGAARAMQLALRDAGWKAEEVQYINAHGTSTPLNDRIESMAIRRVFGIHANRMGVSSIKSMIGHMIGASAAVGMISTVLSMVHGRVPPTINQDNPDPECDLDYVPNESRKLELRAALVNSFGFGGHCVSLGIGRYVPSRAG